MKIIKISTTVKHKSKSLATSITQERIRVLNKRISMEIIDIKDENGEAVATRVVFDMPY